MDRILRSALAIFGSIIAFAATAAAQSYTDIPLTPKQSGGVYPLTLSAENKNCNQLLDFRFTSRAPWITLPADPVARQIPQGQSRNVQAAIDLTNVAPGQIQGVVEVECENCGFFIFASCKIDKQQLRFNLDVLKIGAAGPGGPPGGQAGGGGNPPPPGDILASPRDGFTPPPRPPAPAVSPDDPNQPKTVRDKWRRACARLKDAQDKIKDCDEEAAKLQKAADEASAALKEASGDYDKLAGEALKDIEAVAKLEDDLSIALSNALDASAAYRAAEDALAKLPKGEWFTVTQGGIVYPSRQVAEMKRAEEAAKTAVETLKAAKSALDKARIAMAVKSKKMDAALAALQAAQSRSRAAQDALRAKLAECEKLRQEAERAAKQKEEAEDEAQERCGTPF